MSCNCCSCHDHEHHDCEKEDNKKILYLRMFLSGLLFVFGLVLKVNEIYRIIIFLIGYLIIGYDVIFNALKNIVKGKIFDEHFLMTLATIVAFIIKEYPEAVAVMLFYQVGEYFQDLALDKSKKSINNLFDLSSMKVITIRNNNEEVIDVKDIKINDIIKIKKGDKIPVDGIIINGNSLFDTASLTGESMPLSLKENEKVLSGFINLESVILMKCETVYLESTSYKVAKMIKEASKSQAKSERFITKFSKVYTPIVILFSILLAFIPPLILGFNEYFVTFLNRALLFLVISCPCALVISIPLSFFSGIGKSAQNGILFKGASYLENLSTVKIAAFDKTGTLTEGSFKVTEVIADDVDYVLSILYSLEINSNHPIAKSICIYCKNNNIQLLNMTDVKEISGQGLIGNYEDKIIKIGNIKLFDNLVPINKQGTVIYISENNHIIGHVVLNDNIKENVKKAIECLKNNGIEKTYLLSGDRNDVVNDVAKQLNIDEAYGQLLPEDKVKIVEKLSTEGVVYCGDGINDAAVILKANVGIAMGGIGSDVAISASDIVFIDDNIENLNVALKISKKTMKITKQNIIFAIGVKVIVMILGAIGFAPMWSAIFADVGVSLLAILNSLRIMYGKIK